jgi:hypothetical protein
MSHQIHTLKQNATQTLGTLTITVHPTKVENYSLTSQQKWQNNKPEKCLII